MPVSFVRGVLLLFLLSPTLVRALDKTYRDALSKNIGETTQNFLKHHELVRLERNPKFVFPKYSTTELDQFLISHFGGAYDGQNPLIDEYIRFFSSRPLAQLQLWFTMDEQFSEEMGGFEGKPHEALTHDLLRSQLNYPNFHDNESLLLPYPVSLVYGNKKEGYVDDRWHSQRHFSFFSGYLSFLFNSMNRTSHAFGAAVLGAATITRIKDYQIKNYWELYEQLQHQNRDFYPAMLAASFVFHQLEQGGMKKLQVKSKQEWVELTSDFLLNLQVLTAELKLKDKSIVKKNQVYFQRIVPPNATFLLPKAFLEKFRAQEIEIAKESAYQIHKVKAPLSLIVYRQKPEELLDITAKNFNTTKSEIVILNTIDESIPRNKTALFIPVPIKDSAFYATFDTLGLIQIEEQIKLRKEQIEGWPEDPKPKKPVVGNQKIYVIKGGDTLGAIGRKYGVTVKQIMQWNNLKSTNIQIGQKLVIKK